MGFKCSIVKDSIAPNGRRLTTLVLTYPRIIHAEVMTHRDRARNAGSSRAIPFHKSLNAVVTEPFEPLVWGLEQSGMQTGGEISEHLRPLARELWDEALGHVANLANQLHNIEYTYLLRDLEERFPAFNQERQTRVSEITNRHAKGELERVHKSLPNRLLEPWSWITVVMTATEWKNFFRLRCHPDAEIHFQKIAGMARDIMAAHTPEALNWGDWHLPFVSEEEQTKYSEQTLCKVSTARCARVSYLTHEGVRSVEKDLELYERLVQGSGFGHWSPHEHVAKAGGEGNENLSSGPFKGWQQFRKFHANENADALENG